MIWDKCEQAFSSELVERTILRTIILKDNFHPYHSVDSSSIHTQEIVYQLLAIILKDNFHPYHSVYRQ